MAEKLIRPKTLLGALLFSSIGLIILSLVSSVEWAMLPQTIRQLGLRGFFFIALLFCIFYCADALRLKTLAAAGKKKLSFTTAILCAMGGSFLTNISPFFLGAGLLYSVIYKMKGLSWPTAVSLMIAGAFFNHMTHFGLGLIILIRHQANPLFLHQAKNYLLLIYLSILLLFLIAFFFNRKVERLLKGRGYLEEILRQALEGFSSIWMSGRKNLSLLFLASIIYFFSFYGVAVYIFQFLIPDSPFMLVYPLQLLSYLFSLPVPTPGASGGMELVSLSTFSLLAPVEQVGQVIVIWRIIIYYLPLVIGGPALLLLSVKEGITKEDLNKRLFTLRTTKDRGVTIYGRGSNSFTSYMSRLWKKDR